MEKQEPVYKENPLTTLRTELTKALSTIDRLMVEENPVMDRNKETKQIDSWCVQLTEENRIAAKEFDGNKNWHYKVGSYVGVNKNGIRNGIYGLKWAARFDRLISTEEFYNKIGYTKQTENILEKGKEVLNSQNENPINRDELIGYSTVDNKWIKRGDVVWVLIDESFKFHSVVFDPRRYYDRDVKFFSEKEKCQDYILMNKPLLSLNDLLSVCGTSNYNNSQNSPMFKNFKTLAESKLNNK